MIKKLINAFKKIEKDPYLPEIYHFLKDANNADILYEDTVALVFALRNGRDKNTTIIDLSVASDYSDDHDEWIGEYGMYEEDIIGYCEEKMPWLEIFKIVSNNIIDVLHKDEFKKGIFAQINYIGIYWGESNVFMIKNNGKIQNKMTDYDVKINTI